MQLSRTPEGIVHVAGCTTARGPQSPWLWAQSFTGEQLLAMLNIDGLCCAKCEPFRMILLPSVSPHCPDVTGGKDAVYTAGGIVVARRGRRELGKVSPQRQNLVRLLRLRAVDGCRIHMALRHHRRTRFPSRRILPRIP